MTVLRFTSQNAWPDDPPVSLLFGSTEKMQMARRKLESVINTSIPVLIQGESGTGKELCVRLMHVLGDRTPDSLIKVSCPAIPHALLETELFGYEKGAFTGAQTTKRGRVEQAHNGTLFLDEVGSLDLGMQAKLLQLLQDGSFSRVGGHEVRKIQTRLVSVANRDLQQQVADGSFRLDFLYRINTITINLPPLRERTDDIPDIAEYFFERHARLFRVKPAPLSRAILRQMKRFTWPGNIRQLDNMIRSYVLIGNEETMMAEMMPLEAAAGEREGLLPEIDVSSPIALKAITKQMVQELERRAILKVLRANGFNRQKTAKWLKISYRSLLYKLNETGPQALPSARQAPLKKAATATPGAPFGTGLRLL